MVARRLTYRILKEFALALITARISSYYVDRENISGN